MALCQRQRFESLHCRSASRTTSMQIQTSNTLTTSSFHPPVWRIARLFHRLQSLKLPHQILGHLAVADPPHPIAVEPENAVSPCVLTVVAVPVFNLQLAHLPLPWALPHHWLPGHFCSAADSASLEAAQPVVLTPAPRLPDSGPGHVPVRRQKQSREPAYSIHP